MSGTNKKKDIPKELNELNEKLDHDYYLMDWRSTYFRIHPNGAEVDMIFEEPNGVKIGVALNKADVKMIRKRLKSISNALLD